MSAKTSPLLVKIENEVTTADGIQVIAVNHIQISLIDYHTASLGWNWAKDDMNGWE